MVTYGEWLWRSQCIIVAFNPSFFQCWQRLKASHHFKPELKGYAPSVPFFLQRVCNVYAFTSCYQVKQGNRPKAEIITKSTSHDVTTSPSPSVKHSRDAHASAWMDQKGAHKAHPQRLRISRLNRTPPWKWSRRVIFSLIFMTFFFFLVVFHC